MGDEFTEQDFTTWVPASDAYRVVGNVVGPATAGEILKRLSVGLLTARCENAFQVVRGVKKQQAPLALIGEAVWKRLMGDNTYLHALELWSANSAEVQYPGTPSATVYLFGVRFDPEGIQKMLPKRVERLQEPPAVLPAPKHAGGAPPKPFWDALWADIGAQLYVGDLKPQKQGDLEKAMLNWATANNEELGEQSARTRARLIWQAIREKDKDKN